MSSKLLQIKGLHTYSNRIGSKYLVSKLIEIVVFGQMHQLNGVVGCDDLISRDAIDCSSFLPLHPQNYCEKDKRADNVTSNRKAQELVSLQQHSELWLVKNTFDIR